MTIKYGYEISEKTEIGQGFAIMHLGGIAININTKIGENCTIYKGVTIGGAVKSGIVTAPVIGNRVWIGPNSTIVGNVVIGDDVLIAGNTFINKDVPKGTLVINGSMIYKKFTRMDDYIQYIRK